jgi:hypothetical protein
MRHWLSTPAPAEIPAIASASVLSHYLASVSKPVVPPSVVPRGTLHSLSDLLPPHGNGPEWIGKAGVFTMGIEPLSRLRIAAKELVQRSVVLVNEVV